MQGIDLDNFFCETDLICHLFGVSDFDIIFFRKISAYLVNFDDFVCDGGWLIDEME